MWKPQFLWSSYTHLLYAQLGSQNGLCAAHVTFEKITFIACPPSPSQSAENSRNALQRFTFKGNLCCFNESTIGLWVGVLQMLTGERDHKV